MIRKGPKEDVIIYEVTSMEAHLEIFDNGIVKDIVLVYRKIKQTYLQIWTCNMEGLLDQEKD